MIDKLKSSRFARLLASLAFTVVAILVAVLAFGENDQVAYGVALTFIVSFLFQIIYDLLDSSLTRKSFFAFLRSLLFWIITAVAIFVSFMLSMSGDADPEEVSFIGNVLIWALTLAPTLTALVYTIAAQKGSSRASVVLYPFISILAAVPMGLVCTLLVQLSTDVFGTLAPAAMAILVLILTIKRHRDRGNIFKEKDQNSTSVSQSSTTTEGLNEAYESEEDDEEEEEDDRQGDSGHWLNECIKDCIFAGGPFDVSPCYDIKIEADVSYNSIEVKRYEVEIGIYVSESVRVCRSGACSNDEITRSEYESIKSSYSSLNYNRLAHNIADTVANKLPELNEEYYYDEYLGKRIKVNVKRSGIDLSGFTVVEQLS